MFFILVGLFITGAIWAGCSRDTSKDWQNQAPNYSTYNRH